MELIQYFRLFRKWLWLIVICAVLAGGAAFIQSSRQPEQYRARVTMVVGTYYVDPNPEAGEIRIGVDLAQTYVQMAKNHAVLQAAIEEGNLGLTPGQLAGAIATNVVGTTSLIELTVTHGDPITAVNIADEVANQLIFKSPSNLTPEQQSQVDLANSEIARLREQLDQARVRLEDVQAELEETTDPERTEELNEQYNTLITQINQASATIADFQSTISQLQQRTNALEIFEPARLLGAIPDNTMRNTVLATMVGAALAIGVALLIEYLDDSIRTPEQATQLLEMPNIAAIPKFGKRRASYEDKLITIKNPGAPASEEYRTLRANLLYASNGRKTTFLVTSPGPSEGKTITTSNLAVTMAAAGWRVLLIDADLRRPRLHEVFSLDNRLGLTSLLAFMPEEAQAGAHDRLELVPDLEDCIKETTTPGLRVITSGHIPLNPAEVLGSASMQQWYKKFLMSQDIDIILFDTPPVLAAADAAVLASTIDIPAILVLESGRTSPGNAVRAKERMQALDVNIKGTVLNAISPRDQKYYGGYYYYYYYRSSDQSQNTPQD